MTTNNFFNSWLAGFIDGEGCFHVSVVERNNKWKNVQVNIVFSIGQKEQEIMEWLRPRLGFTLYKKSKPKRVYKRISREFPATTMYVLCTKSHDDCMNLVRRLSALGGHLKTKKRIDFELFKEACMIKKNKLKRGEKAPWLPGEITRLRVIEALMKANKRRTT